MSIINLSPTFDGDCLTYAGGSVRINLRDALAGERDKSTHLRILGMILSSGVLAPAEVAACATAYAEAKP